MSLFSELGENRSNARCLLQHWPFQNDGFSGAAAAINLQLSKLDHGLLAVAHLPFSFKEVSRHHDFLQFCPIHELIEMAVVFYLTLSLQNFREALRRIWQGPGSKLFAFVLPEDRFAGRHIKETPRYQHVHVANEVPSHNLYVL